MVRRAGRRLDPYHEPLDRAAVARRGLREHARRSRSFDPLGRTFLTIEDNGGGSVPDADELDIQGIRSPQRMRTAW